MSDIPDTNDINKLAAWFDKDTLELIGHILNKHTKACLFQMKELVIERKELKKRLAAAEAKIPKWIPVKERLPKPGATVLAVDNSGDMGVCTFVNAKFIGECFGFEAYLNNGGWDCFASKIIGEYVTHWMTPEPPVNGSEGE